MANNKNKRILTSKLNLELDNYLLNPTLTNTVLAGVIGFVIVFTFFWNQTLVSLIKDIQFTYPTSPEDIETANQLFNSQTFFFWYMLGLMLFAFVFFMVSYLTGYFVLSLVKSITYLLIRRRKGIRSDKENITKEEERN